MSELLVSLDILTSSAALAEITALLGIEPSATRSHEKGDPRPSGTWPMTVWSLASPMDRSAPLDEHLTALFAKASLDGKSLSLLPADSKIYLNVGILSFEEIDSITLSRDLIDQMSSHGMELEATFYVCADDGLD